MDNYFALVPTNHEELVALVVREAEDEWQETHLPSRLLDHCAREAVDGLWDGQVKTFVPLLALRRVRACIRAGTCDCDDW